MCKLMVSPKNHGIRIESEYKSNTPGSKLCENLYLGKWTGQKTDDPKLKYSTLSQLNLSEYFIVFWTLHDRLVLSLLQSLVSINALNDTTISRFARLLIETFENVYCGNICDAPWNNICMVCERFYH